MLVQKDLLRLSPKFTAWNVKLADEDLSARTFLMQHLETYSAMYLTADAFIQSLKTTVRDPEAIKTLECFEDTWTRQVDVPVFLFRQHLKNFFKARLALREHALTALGESLAKDELLLSEPFSTGLFPVDSFDELRRQARQSAQTLSMSLLAAPRKQQARKRKSFSQGQQRWGFQKKFKGSYDQGSANQSQSEKKKWYNQPKQQQQQKNQKSGQQQGQKKQQPFRGNRKYRGRGAGRGGKGRGSGGTSNQPKPSQSGSKQ